MKRVNNLYPKIVSYENISLAIDNASKTKKDHSVAKRIYRNRNFYIKAIQSNFHVSGKYRLKKHIDASSMKERILEIPPFYPDQIIQHALVDVTLPYFLKRFIDQTCCSIKGRGTLYASNIVRKAIRSGSRYYVKFDIRKYFPNVDHEILKEQVRRLFKDKQVLALYDEIIDSTPKGLPIGNYTSQPLANLYLTPLDRFIKEKLKVRYYVRYMDDFIIFGSNRRKLDKLIPIIDGFVSSSLKLQTHPDKRVMKIAYRSRSGKTIGSPVDFCGFRHYQSYVTIRRRVWRKARRALIRQETNPCLVRGQRTMCYYGYIVHSDSKNVFRRYGKGLNISKDIVKRKEIIQ